jgi:hypothetical protein
MVAGLSACSATQAESTFGIRDGATDCAQRINAAFAAGFSTVELPAGDFELETSVVVGGDDMPPK